MVKKSLRIKKLHSPELNYCGSRNMNGELVLKWCMKIYYNHNLKLVPVMGISYDTLLSH